MTSLADSGPGSLREALAASGNRTIVFNVGGEIWLDEMLKINRPFVTVAGETAPSPGISVMGDIIKIHTHDVVLRHIRVRPGARPGGTDPVERDGIQMAGTRDDPTYNILIENCSVSWSVDELISIFGTDNHDIAVRSSIISEGLNDSIHPEGEHSTGLRIGANTKKVLVQGSLLAHNGYRNPLVAGGSTVVIVNNLVYNPGGHAIHFNIHDDTRGPTFASVVSNYVVRGPSTTNKPRLPAFDGGLPENSAIYYKDNDSEGVEAFDPNELVSGSDRPIPFVSQPPIWLAPIDVVPSSQVQSMVLNNAGARPWDRDAIDARIVNEVRSRSGTIRDAPTDSRLAP